VSTLGIALSTLGGLAELIGSALVVLDVRHARHAARDVASQSSADATRRAAEHLDAQRRFGSSGPARLASYGGRDDAQYAQDTMRREMDTLFAAALLHADERDRTLREFLAGELRGGIGRSVGGAVLIAIGVVL
jgi:hypothetical protein